ncbi:unnamed protein product [Trifolium pratense]|uniref:Uncharacterized protein n=1 Tax=Trifolium pratense TaxID=57577 RepID=A0ACB0M5J9_TRIPR|nr:unnamed protein product [Trifolium pratense]
MLLLSAINTSTLPFTFKSQRIPLRRNPSCFLQTINASPNSDSDDNSSTLTLSSTRALAAAISKVSTSPVEFTQRLEKDRRNGLVLPSPDFHRLCLQQLHLFRRIVPESFLSVYVRPAGSYVMDRLELQRVALYPGGDAESDSDGIVILVAHFNVPAGLRATETILSELQKAMLLQQSTWQNNVRMNNLVEQIRGPLSSIQTLGKILSTQTKKSQISYDIVEDILSLGDRLSDVLHQLQDAVHLTKANIMRYNEESIKKMNGSNHIFAGSVKSQFLDSSPRDGFPNKMNKSGEPLSLGVAAQDIEMPLPPLALTPLQPGIRPCNVSEILADLVETIRPLALNQKRVIELSQLSSTLLAAVEEPALRQAFSNLIEGALLRTRVGGKVAIVSTDAPAGGTLVLIDDDGPDMHYMTQMHSLTPYGQELLAEDMIEDNMTWNFVAGLTIAREILESYGCVVRIISPRTKDGPLGAGGTRVELWLPTAVVQSDV